MNRGMASALLLGMTAAALLPGTMGRPAGREVAAPGGDYSLNAIACPAAGVCYAVGNNTDHGTAVILALTAGGRAWREQPTSLENTSAATATLSGVACADARTCFAVGTGGTIVATIAGAPWQRLRGVPAVDLTAVACMGATACYALGARGTLLRTTDRGATWPVQRTVPRPGIVGLSCVPTACYALDRRGDLLTAAPGGQPWRVQAGTKAPVKATGFTCGSVNVCYALNADAHTQARLVATKDGGRTWRVQINVAYDPNDEYGDTTEFYGVFCADATDCYLAVYSANSRTTMPPLVSATHNGGQRWNDTEVDAASLLRAGACTSPTTCYAVGDTSVPDGYSEAAIVATADGGHTWHAWVAGAPAQTSASAQSGRARRAAL